MLKTVNTKQIADMLSESVDFNLSKSQAEQVLDLLVDLMTKLLIDAIKVKLNRLGSFELRMRKGRKCVDPRDNKTEMFVPEIQVIKFRSSYTLKNKIRGRTC